MKNTYLETPRVALREMTLDDAALLMDLDSDPDVMLYLTGGRPSTPEEIKGAMERILALKERHQGRFGLWAATEKFSGEFMGWFHFRPGKLDPFNEKSIELGYRLKKKFWGKGFAVEVSAALIEKGFCELGVEEVWARTLARNTKSRRVMEKLGLKFDHSYIEHEFPGEDKEAVRYSLSRESFLKLT